MGRVEGVGLANLRRAGYSHLIRFIEEPSYRGLAELERSGQIIDFAFIDGHHAFDYALVDFFLIDRMLRPGGIVAFDDAGWPAVRKVCRFVRTSRAYKVIPGPDDVQEASLKRRAAERIAGFWPFRRLARPEISVPDSELGLAGSCIAFRKEGDDNRSWEPLCRFLNPAALPGAINNVTYGIPNQKPPGIPGKKSENIRLLD